MFRQIIVSLFVFGIAGCQSSAPKPHAAKTPELSHAAPAADDPQFTHTQSGMYFPKSIGKFVRSNAKRFNQTGSDMSVSYWIRGENGSNYVSVYIYPAAAQWRPGAAEDDTYDALEKNMMCSQELAFRSRELTKVHPDTAVGKPKPLAIVQNGATHDGVRLSFYTMENFRGTPQTTKEEFDLFCFATELWTITYRFSFQDYPGADDDIAQFLRELKWPQ